MNMADRIQSLRKAKGISQEQLADKIGVSRQAVSKWESEQSTPDIEKVILLSEFFDVTTDYLLKGIEPVVNDSTIKKYRLNAMIFSIIGTALNLMGVIATAMIWYEEQKVAEAVSGVFLIIFGCMIYGVGMVISDVETKSKAKRIFVLVNVWIIMFMPLSILHNYLTSGYVMAPYPVIIGSTAKYALFWIIYIAVGVVVDFIICRILNSLHLKFIVR